MTGLGNRGLLPLIARDPRESNPCYPCGDGLRAYGEFDPPRSRVVATSTCRDTCSKISAQLGFQRAMMRFGSLFQPLDDRFVQSTYQHLPHSNPPIAL